VKALLFLLAISAAAVAADFDQAAIKQYCLGCHNAKLKSGNLTLESSPHPGTQEKILRRLRARQMPPSGIPRPKDNVYKEWIASLETRLDREAAGNPNPGRTDTFRRLNRTEYQNAIRDLLAVDLDVSSLLPSDDASHGFDNVTVGNLSPSLLERYLDAAQKISRLAVGVPPKAPGGDTVILPPDLTQEEHFEGMPLGTRGGTSIRHTFPADGEYEFQLRLARDRNEQVEGLRDTHEVELAIDGVRVQIFTVTQPKGADHSTADQHLHVKHMVKAGPHTVAVAFLKKPSLLMETSRQPYSAHFNMDRHPRIQPAIYSVTINGPYTVSGSGDTPSRQRIFACQDETDACALQIVQRLQRRAYRRPVTVADAEAPLRFYREARKQGGFELGIEMALRAVLVSPEFLFRVERDPKPAPVAAGNAYRISDIELASRLSFFLWSSIPDEALLAVAEKGSLHTPAELEKQTRRMLADPRSKALASNFAGQWLYLRNLANASPDMRLFPDFDDNLRRAFRRETELLFEDVQTNDRSVLELLSADYTYLNERLAKHYGIPNVYGDRFRRVQLAAGNPRRGLLGHGSILTVTSYTNRTSPVIRGKWVLDNLLGVPPPPPPAAVPALKENTGGIGGRNLSMRERLSEHRDNPACSGCHKLMDPVGFALENYDAVGRWRDVDETGRKIDAAGGLPDGSSFDGAVAMQKALLQRPELFAGTFAEKLLTYAVGRGVETYDAPAIRAIVRQAAQDKYRFSAFILGITTSNPFLMRKRND
jgi:hypothetical protein